jgi:hypothetical protein
MIGQGADARVNVFDADALGKFNSGNNACI